MLQLRKRNRSYSASQRQSDGLICLPKCKIRRKSCCCNCCGLLTHFEYCNMNVPIQPRRHPKKSMLRSVKKVLSVAVQPPKIPTTRQHSQYKVDRTPKMAVYDDQRKKPIENIGTLRLITLPQVVVKVEQIRRINNVRKRLSQITNPMFKQHTQPSQTLITSTPKNNKTMRPIDIRQIDMRPIDIRPLDNMVEVPKIYRTTLYRHKTKSYNKSCSIVLKSQ